MTSEIKKRRAEQIEQTRILHWQFVPNEQIAERLQISLEQVEENLLRAYGLPDDPTVPTPNQLRARAKAERDRWSEHEKNLRTSSAYRSIKLTAKGHPAGYRIQTVSTFGNI